VKIDHPDLFCQAVDAGFPGEARGSGNHLAREEEYRLSIADTSKIARENGQEVETGSSKQFLHL